MRSYTFLLLASALAACSSSNNDPDPSGSGGSGGSGGGSSSSSGGGGVVNLGCAEDPSLTPAEKQLIDMPADTWLEVPGTRFDEFCAAHEPAGAHGIVGCTAIIGAWSGGAWDPIHRQMLLWGGGHGDYYGNEVYGFSPRTSKWELLVPGTPVGSSAELSEPMSDGTPVSRHTYDGLAYLTAENRFFGFGGATAPDGNSSGLTWALDLDEKTWKQLDTKLSLPVNHDGYFWMGTAYDEAGHRVFMRNEDGVYVFDIATDTWTRLVDAGYPPLYPNWSKPSYRRGVFDTKRKIFFTLGGALDDGKLDFFAFDTQTNQALLDAWATTGGDDLAKVAGPGADYDPVADAIVAWGGGPARVLDLNTKAWSTKSGTGAPATPVEKGTYGRFRYIAQYNVFVLVNGPDQNVYFYKHTAGCGP
ncbi:hypothetical protein [Polyangium sp. y55x31]|uniref:hypothetical protein n=1 Tax=Polyangium sp. y55x31 TaxID=3042688 RepID=UPI0024829430|nr:hypothetical protein [Polyangium sp. y55x31]MDI1474999.1 hypothetical protein [Polyangium sp. y55x31]